MAPPPLPPDYGSSGNSTGGGWNAPTPAATTNPAPPANDDWGWSDNTASSTRYQNAPTTDDPWDTMGTSNNDNNYNQAGSKDPFDPFDNPPQQSSIATNPVTASANQVTSHPQKKKRIQIEKSECFDVFSCQLTTFFGSV